MWDTGIHNIPGNILWENAPRQIFKEIYLDKGRARPRAQRWIYNQQKITCKWANTREYITFPAVFIRKKRPSRFLSANTYYVKYFHICVDWEKYEKREWFWVVIWKYLKEILDFQRMCVLYVLGCCQHSLKGVGALKKMGGLYKRYVYGNETGWK